MKEGVSYKDYSHFVPGCKHVCMVRVEYVSIKQGGKSQVVIWGTTFFALSELSVWMAGSLHLYVLINNRYYRTAKRAVKLSRR